MRLIFVPALIIVASPTDEQVATLLVVAFTVAFALHASAAEAWIRITRRRDVAKKGRAKAV